ncbi:MAG: ABC transporter substrate-binding protein [bacterium]|jgi:putative ABC transport system substrate-binding protein
MVQGGRRRLLLAGSALFVAPRVARAQRAQKVYRIGFLSPTAPGLRDQAFLMGMRELGYVEGRNAQIEMRFAEGRPERLPGLAEELIGLKPDVLAVGSTIGARAVKKATTTIPIVFAGSSDPVAGGLVPNLAHPGGNITGFSLAYGDGFAGKWMELLKEVTPEVSHVAALWSSSNAAAVRFVKELQTAAQKLEVTLDVHHATNLAELDPALAAIGRSRARGLIVVPSPFAATNRRKLVQFAASNGLPAVYFFEKFADEGGLMSYGPDFADVYRRAASHVDKILKGAKPGDLPVENPTKFDLVVNLKTARALGIAIPQSVLLRANRVIE